MIGDKSYVDGLNYKNTCPKTGVSTRQSVEMMLDVDDAIEREARTPRNYGTNFIVFLSKPRLRMLMAAHPDLFPSVDPEPEPAPSLTGFELEDPPVGEI